MRRIISAAVVAFSLLFSSLPTHAQKVTQTWHRWDVPTPHWFTTFDLGWGKTRFDAIFIPDHGVTFTVRVDCPNKPNAVALHVYGVGMTDGVWMDCVGVLGKTQRNLNFWLMLVGELPREVNGLLTQRDTDGFGPPAAIFD